MAAMIIVVMVLFAPPSGVLENIDIHDEKVFSAKLVLWEKEKDYLHHLLKSEQTNHLQ
jgi:hypothetical protein